MEPLLQELLTDQIVVYNMSTLDNYGKRSWSATGTTYRCRLMYDVLMTRDSAGRQVFEKGRAIVDGTPGITTDMKIVLPDGSSPVVLSIDEVSDETGAAHHTVVRFGQ
jgi:hypothetical protein